MAVLVVVFIVCPVDGRVGKGVRFACKCASAAAKQHTHATARPQVDLDSTAGQVMLGKWRERARGDEESGGEEASHGSRDLPPSPTPTSG